MKKRHCITCIFLLMGFAVNAQEVSNQQQETPIVNNVDNSSIDFATIQLPPLSVLYANARSNPSVAILEKEKQLQKRLLSKEKKGWLTFFSARAGYAYGITDNVGTVTDIATPVYTQYSGIQQNYWNVGGNMNVPLEALFDLKGKVKRQKLEVEKAELAKEQAYEQVKQQIAHLYVQILSNIETLKRSAEHLALFKGASAIAEQEYRNKRTIIGNVAETKRKEFEANSSFEGLRANIQEQLLILEIISHTPILTSMNENK